MLRRAWQPTLVFLPGESPQIEESGGLQYMGQKESDMTELLSTAHPGINSPVITWRSDEDFQTFSAQSQFEVTGHNISLDIVFIVVHVLNFLG